MRTLILYVKPHVQEDPLSMILGIAYLGASLERQDTQVGHKSVKSHNNDNIDNNTPGKVTA